MPLCMNEIEEEYLYVLQEYVSLLQHKGFNQETYSPINIYV